MPGTACLQLLLLLAFRLLKEVLEILILLSILNDTAAAGLVVALRQLLVFSYIEHCVQLVQSVFVEHVFYALHCDKRNK